MSLGCLAMSSKKNRKHLLIIEKFFIKKVLKKMGYNRFCLWLNNNNNITDNDKQLMLKYAFKYENIYK